MGRPTTRRRSIGRSLRRGSSSSEPGRYKVSNALRSAAVSQRISGAGRGQSVIVVGEDFSMAARGVFSIEHNFVILEDVEVEFDQSSAFSRASLVAYPPAVNCSDQSRVRVQRVRFTAAYDGLVALGNTGGALFDDIESGSLNLGFHLAGALDTVEFRNCRTWPYNFAGNGTLFNIFIDGETIGFRIGRCDDLKMSNCTPYRTRMIFENTDGSAPFGSVTGLALDGSSSRIDMYDGDLEISSLYCTSAEANDYALNVYGGNLALSDFVFRFGETANVPVVHVNGSSANCMISNGKVELGFGISADAFKAFLWSNVS